MKPKDERISFRKDLWGKLCANTRSGGCELRAESRESREKSGLMVDKLRVIINIVTRHDLQSKARLQHV